MKTSKYTTRTFWIVILSFMIGGMCQAQSKSELKGIPPNESGISVEEYNDILNHKYPTTLYVSKGLLSISICDTNKVSNNQTHPPKDINRVYPRVPYRITPTIPFLDAIKEEGYDENN